MPSDSQQIQLDAKVPNNAGGMRIDAMASSLFPDYSRARLQTWIKDGVLTLDGQPCRSKDKCYGGERLSLNVVLEAAGDWVAQDIDLDVVFEDEHILVLNKPAGLVVHPGAGNHDGTLLNALLHHCPDLQLIPRAGIVHRLDKDTTGLMVVAKTLIAQNDLVAQLQARTVKREYDALALGRIIGGGTRSKTWREIVCNVIGSPIEVPENGDASYGAALIAGVGAGVFSSELDAVDRCVKITERIEPNRSLHEFYQEVFSIYKESQAKLAAINHRITDMQGSIRV